MDKTFENILDRAREIYRDPAAALAKDVNLTNEGSIAAIRVALIDLFSDERLRESEDERIRREIYNFLIDMECKEEWINYLEKQKVQKPAEWSEKDNVQLNAAIQIVSNSGHYTTANWLKSLRPQPSWKPSEEQMKMLESLPGLLRDFKLDTSAQVLEVLREQLKKL